MEKMQKVQINVIIKALKESAKNPKNAPTDRAIMDMLLNTSLEFLQVEETRGGSMYNRGSIVECITRYALNDYLRGCASSTYKKSVKNEDFTTMRKNRELLQDLGLEPNKEYEIKLITSLARASMSSIIKNDVIMIDLRNKTRGAYLVKPNDLILYNGSSIKDYNNGVKLDLLCELLGLE
jgi:hypothetical protein